MKNNQLKRGLALALVLAMIFTLFISVNIPTSAATQPSTYSKQNNSGERDVICTTLNGTSASSYYTGSYTFAALSALSSSQLKVSLNTLMKANHKLSSYSDCKNYATRTDCENGDGRVVLLYTSYSATSGDYISGSTGWNREHVWPKSLGGDSTSGGGADLHHIRPDDNKTNSTRGSKKFGNVSGGTNVTGSSTVGTLSGGTYAGNYFEPLDNVKGDVARICLYVYVRWGSAWGADNITKVFESVDVLLEWCELDPVDTWEMGRNEVVQAIQGNRNVFIDYPEYAWLLFDRDVPEDYVTPSGNAGVSGGNGGNGGSTGGDTGNNGGNGGGTGGDTGNNGGNGGNGGGTTTPPAVDTSDDKPITSPSVNVAYKGMIDAAKFNTTLYMQGYPAAAERPWYISASKTRSDGIDIFAEKVSGSDDHYRLYFMDGSQKKYIRAYERTDKAGSGTLELTTSVPSEYYTFDSTLGTFVVKNGSNTFFLGANTGTQGTLYETIGCINTSYITGSNASNLNSSHFVLKFVLSDASATPTEPGEIESDSESDTLDGTDLEETGEVESQSSSENMTDSDIDTGADLDTGDGTPDNGDEVYTQEENRGDEIYTQEENRGDEIYTQEENQGDGNGGSGGNGGEPDSGAESNGGDDESGGGDGSKLGCGSSIGGGIAVIISISVGGALTLRRKREE